MKEKLEKLLNNAHTPYYNYPVASIIEMKDGSIFEGVNVETSSPSAGICAERNAIYSAFAKGYKKGDIKRVHVMNKTDKFSYPCFVCRQALNDLCDESTEVTVYNNKGETNTVTINDLCTHSFDEDNLV